MNNNKIERAAIRSVEEYIDKCPKLEPFIYSNDKTPIWDGDIYIYDNANTHSVKHFLNRTPLQVKGTTNCEDEAFSIEREYIEGFKADRGCVFFLVQESKETCKILFSLLSMNEIDTLLESSNKTIRIPLDIVPDDSQIFEQKIIKFAERRAKEKLENLSPVEIKTLVNEFKKIKQQLGKIEKEADKYEIESLINSIENLDDEGTTGWRDKFIYYSYKAIELASQSIKGYDFIGLRINLGVFCYNQKNYHLAEEYYKKSQDEIYEHKKA